jgi:hypothetical protein
MKRHLLSEAKILAEKPISNQAVNKLFVLGEIRKSGTVLTSVRK